VSGSAKIDAVSGSAKIDVVYGYGSVNICNESSIILFGFAVVWVFIKNTNIIKKSETSVIINVSYKNGLEEFQTNNQVDLSGDHVILFKRVSSDFKTQENTKNETIWEIGKLIEHKNWSPELKECGGGKFHACSLPVFCNEFRNTEGDKYIAIKIDKKDLFAWVKPQYPHKIAFRAGVVLYECDIDGNKIN
jgi:hypothetical protein